MWAAFENAHNQFVVPPTLVYNPMNMVFIHEGQHHVQRTDPQPYL